MCVGRLTFLDEKSLSTIMLWCILSRAVCVVMIILSNICLPDHAASGVNIYVFEDDNVHDVWKSFTKWDAAYFLQIARDGYQSESSFAFFPLYPLCIRLLGKYIFCWTSLSIDKCNIIAGVFISNCCFVVSVLVLWHLLKQLKVSNVIRCQSLLLFFCNPASVFFSSIYSESLYSFLAFSGMLFWERKLKGIATILFILSSSTRSNGVMNVIFILLHDIIFHCRAEQIIRQTNRGIYSTLLNYFIKGAGMGFYCCLCTFPFVAYDKFVRMFLCCPNGEFSLSSLDFAVLKLSEVVFSPPMDIQDGMLYDCEDQSLLNVYSSIQRNYWNVGFLRFYTVKQIPNFLLATPALSLCLLILRFFTRELYEKCCCEKREVKSVGVGVGNIRSCLQDLSVNVPYLGHMVVVAMLSLLFAHIQISTRMLFSSCPLICYHVGYIIHGENSEVGKKWDLQFEPLALCGCWGCTVFLYFLLYNVMGLALHPNFFPWT